MKRFLFLWIFLLVLAGCAVDVSESVSETEPAEEAALDTQWWEEYVHAEALQDYKVSGEGVLVAVLDSGVSSHPDFKGLDLQGDLEDPVGHGTFVTGLLSRLMPQANYLSVAITDSATDITVDQIVAGLEYAASRQADVALLSLGLPENVPALQEAIEQLAQTGCLIFSAVGNDGTDTLYYPAAYDTVFGIGSCNLAFEPSETSQYNESVFVLAPGVKMTGPWPGGGYETLKGTSYAVPVAAAMGVAAKCLDPDITVEEFSMLLAQCTTDICENGYDIQSGWGIIDFEKLCKKLS